MNESITPVKDPLCILFDRIDRRRKTVEEIAKSLNRRTRSLHAIPTVESEGVFWTESELTTKNQTVVVFPDATQDPYLQTR
jgi:hypothetical protein